MTGYDLTNRLKKARRKYPLTATEQALYYELSSICNDVEWDDVFTCSNDELCSVLNITENTLLHARNTLIQRGLISYKSGKSRRIFGSYSFTKSLTTSKTEVDTATATATDKGVDKGVDSATATADYTKEKLKLKEKNKYRDNVILLPEENEKLIKELGEQTTHACYDYLSDYKKEKGYKTQSDYLTIKRWVIKAVREKQGKVINLPPQRRELTERDFYTPEEYQDYLNKNKNAS